MSWRVRPYVWILIDILKDMRWRNAWKCILLCGITGVSVSLLTATFAKPAYTTYSDHLSRSLKGPILYDDVELVNYIKNEKLDPPSTLPYNLEGKKRRSRKFILPSESFYNNVSAELFAGMRHGVFVEAGALDGEAMSVTLPFEMRQQWTGLLVEPNGIMYKKLLTKNRKSWSANFCLSPHTFPSMEIMHFPLPLQMSRNNPIGAESRAMGTLRAYTHNTHGSQFSLRNVQCVPLGTLLLATGMKRVDLLVLDVEGAEVDVLSTIDLTYFDIHVIFLEWKKPSEHKKITGVLDGMGYHLIRYYGEDLVFAKIGTKYDVAPLKIA